MGRLLIAFVLVLATSAQAAPGDLRIKLHATDGKLIESPKPCGKATRARVMTLMKRAPLVEVVGGAMTVVANEGERPADRIVEALAILIGFFDRTPMETISIAVDRTVYVDGHRTVRFSVISRNKPEQDLGDACFEQWLGIGQVF